MAKRKSTQDRVDKLRRRLVKAQAAVQQAQQKRALTQVRGERKVEEERLKADARLAKATERVERRAGRAARIESRLLALESAGSAVPDIERSMSDSNGLAADGVQLTDPTGLSIEIEKKPRRGKRRADGPESGA